MEKHVKNLAAYAIVTAAGEVIPPLQTSKAPIDITKRDTAALIKRGALEVVGGVKASGKAADDEGGTTTDPAQMKAGQLKAELDKLGVEYAGNASTEVLRELYVAKLAEQAGQ
ncbi:hypothetical protein [Bordetella petrii]|uniref:hypothetical protein n=1 Tax=Bordetella petrii TaxID=94624 RepID=UPI00372F7EF7